MPPARGVGGLDDAQARDAQLLHARAQVGLQALVVDRQRGRRGGGVDELGRRVQRGVVDDRRDAAAVALDRRPRAPGARLGQVDRAAGLVDERLAVGQPVGDRQRAVAEALGQHLAHRPARRRARGQQRARRRATARRAAPSSTATHEHRGRQREGAAAAIAERRAERPRADEVDVAEPADALHAEADELGQQRDRHQRDDEQRRRSAAA